MNRKTPDADVRRVHADLQHRSLRAVVAVAARGVVVRLLHLVGLLVLARLLTPTELGVAAFGLTLMTIGGFVGDLGLGAAFIRRPVAPSKPELRALLGLQLGVVVPVTVAACAVAVQFGSAGVAVAVMIAALPILAFRTLPTITMERGLQFQTIAAIEVAETLVFYGLSIALAAAGLGVWAVAIAVLVRAAVGTVSLVVVSRALVAPSWSFANLKGLMAFGGLYQGTALATLIRDQGLNVLVAALAGAATLGIWTVTSRILQVPFLLFSSIWRVSYPAMARFVETGADARRIVERTALLAAFGGAALLVPIVGAGPDVVSELLGTQWGTASDLIPIASAGLLISGPVSVATAGYLYARGDALSPLRAVAAETVVWLGVVIALLPSLGIVAIAIGWFGAAVTEAAILARATYLACGARPVRQVVPAFAAATFAGTAGWLLSTSLPPSLLTSLGCAAASEAAFLGIVAWLRPTLRSELSSLARSALTAPRPEALRT